MDLNKPLQNIAPRQKLSRTNKNKDWGIQNVENIIRMGGISNSSLNSKDRINYDLYNNIINRDEFNYVTDPYKSGEDFPARLENYNIITPKLKLLEGEEIKRPFNFRVAAVNSEAISEIEKKKKDLLLQYLESELTKSLIEQGVNIQNPETGQTMTPEQVEKYMNYSEADIRESTANKIAKYLIPEQNLVFKFNKGFGDLLKVAKEFYYVGIESSNPVCESINPLDFRFDKNPDIDFIEDGQWAYHIKYCTISEIIDSYYDDLTDDEVDKLDTKNFKAVNLGLDASNGMIDITTNVPTNQTQNSMSNYVPVIRVEWKSLRKIGFLKYYDDKFQEQETIVDETYNVVKEKGETISWVWINEVWEGTKIGSDIYTRIKPKSVQYRDIDNPSKCKLGYVGAIYSGRNSQPTSIIDLVKHHQYFYNVMMYRLELEVAKAKGKKMVMDLAQIPRSQGMSLEKWMYYFDTTGIAFINSFEEGKDKFAGQHSNFNQFTAVDMSLSQSVGQYISILDKVERMVGDLMGVSAQRLGAISSSETVGGVERSVQQSSHITEPLFYIHNEVKKNVLTQLIECAKTAYPEGKKINYILDDMSRIFLTLDEKFKDADYGVFVTNSAKETQSLEALKGIAQQAVSSGMMSLTELISIFDSESMSDIKATIKDSVQKSDQQKQQEQQSQQQLQQQQEDSLAALEKEKADRLDSREMIKGDIQKELAYIKTFGGMNGSPTLDADNDGTPDIVEYQKLAQQALQHRDKMSLERDKLKSQTEIGNEKNKIDMIKAKQKSNNK
jgi:hypothetical protein